MAVDSKQIDILNVIHAKGKLLVSNGTIWSEIGTGANNTVLTADSSKGVGVKWATADGGGIYGGSGSLQSGTTIVTMATNALKFSSTANNNFFHLNANINTIGINVAASSLYTLRLKGSGAGTVFRVDKSDGVTGFYSITDVGAVNYTNLSLYSVTIAGAGGFSYSAGAGLQVTAGAANDFGFKIRNNVNTLVMQYLLSSGNPIYTLLDENSVSKLQFDTRNDRYNFAESLGIGQSISFTSAARLDVKAAVGGKGIKITGGGSTTATALEIRNISGVQTARILDDGTIDTDTKFTVAQTQVVGAQGASVSDASGGATVDTEARTAINDLLAKVRTHGLIAT